MGASFDVVGGLGRGAGLTMTVNGSIKVNGK